MSDIGDDFAALKEKSRARKLRNKNQSAFILEKNGVHFETHNNGVHLVIMHNDVFVDFWPSTGKFIFRTSSIKGRGVFNLLKKLGVKKS